jgi:NAD(P)-dependent dehydrogenase (short-subunit alcohol dehydrogenase family)
MSKGAVLAMTRSVALDYVKQNIRCNCICPARVHTPIVDGFLAKNYPGREAEMFKKLSEYQPLGRMGKPEEWRSWHFISRPTNPPSSRGRPSRWTAEC